MLGWSCSKVAIPIADFTLRFFLFVFHRDLRKGKNNRPTIIVENEDWTEFILSTFLEDRCFCLYQRTAYNRTISEIEQREKKDALSKPCHIYAIIMPTPDRLHLNIRKTVDCFVFQLIDYPQIFFRHFDACVSHQRLYCLDICTAVEYIDCERMSRAMESDRLCKEKRTGEDKT